MAFKLFYCVLLLFFVSFTVIKGSCLEYGHSCWGAHGKRSGNNKIYHIDLKPATEVDFADVNAIKESSYDSSEDHLKESNDKMSQTSDLTKRDGDDDDSTNDGLDVAKVLKYKNRLFKQMNKTGKRRLSEASADNEAARRNKVDNYMNTRWRRLPIFNMRHYQLDADNWLNELEREREQPRVGASDNEDYI